MRRPSPVFGTRLREIAATATPKAAMKAIGSATTVSRAQAQAVRELDSAKLIVMEPRTVDGAAMCHGFARIGRWLEAARIVAA